MFRDPYRRRSPFADFINWTDYKWDPAPHARGPVRGPWNPQGNRNHSFLQLLVAGLAVFLGVRLLSAFRGHRGSWLGKAVLAALVLGVAAAVSSRRSRRNYW
jgi:hypothetical protein